MPAFLALMVLLKVVVAAVGAKNHTGSRSEWPAALLLWLVLVPIEVALTLFILAGGWGFLPLWLALGVLLFPWTFATRSAVPLGLPRVAAYIGRLPSASFASDPAGASALAAAWALLRSRSRDEASMAWVTDRVAKLSPTRGAGLAAAGLLAAARGDREAARISMRGVRELHPTVCPPTARRVASSYRTADAAARGVWTEVAELGTSLAGDGREAWLLSGVAKALLLEPDAPRGWGLWFRWILAPHRRKTLALVERALAALDGTFISADDTAAPITCPRDGDALDRAMTLHASSLVERTTLRSQDLRAIAQAWDEVLHGDAIALELSARASALGAPAAGAALGALRASIDLDLTALALGANLPLAELTSGGPTACRVRAAVRDQLLHEVELASDGVRRRADERRAIPGADEWREWSALVDAYRRGTRLAGDELRQLAFHKVHGDATHYAVWLYNERKERALANAVFRFLLDEATALDDATAVALQQKNVDCGP